MEDVTLAHAKDHLEELFERASKGEDVRISDPKLGTIKLQPVVGSIGPYPAPVFGLMAGKAHLTLEQALEPLTEDELAWLSGETSP